MLDFENIRITKIHLSAEMQKITTLIEVLLSVDKSKMTAMIRFQDKKKSM